MHESVRLLLDGVIDYAGLFPPAQLELAPALANYLACRGDLDAWMLGRFICPAERLQELIAGIDTRQGGSVQPIRVSVLGRGGETAQQFLEQLTADVRAMASARDEGSAVLLIEGYETRLPADVVRRQDSTAVGELLGRAAGILLSAGLARAPRFVEVPLVGDWRESVPAVVEGVAAHNRWRSTVVDNDTRVLSVKAPPTGVKLRTGGADAAAFPSTAQVALVIHSCREAQVPLKFTAGLHHAIRVFDPGVRAHHHGFLNLLIAGVLAYAMALELHDVLAVIDEQDARQLRFTGETCGWNDAEATLDEIQYARRHRVISFGSCSFDEPRDDLRRLGLLGPV
jgi:hypothetical protein